MVSAKALEDKIKATVGAVFVEVKELGECGGGDKFEAFIVSEAFRDVKIIQRQRMINEALADEMKLIHAFVYKKAITPEQWETLKAKAAQ